MKDVHMACRCGIRELLTRYFAFDVEKVPQTFLLKMRMSKQVLMCTQNRAWKELQTRPAQKSYNLAAFPGLHFQR